MNDIAVDTYEVFAIRYATVQRQASENFIGGDPHETATSMDYFIWVVRSAWSTPVSIERSPKAEGVRFFVVPPTA